MKAVLISIQPKWVEKIISGEKTIELRKNCPRLATPFTAYMYMTKAESYDLRPHKNDWVRQNRGLVVGEFLCKKVEIYIPMKKKFDERYFAIEYDVTKEQLYSMGVDRYQFWEYARTRENRRKEFVYKPLYGLQISDVKRYDKPKELYDFNNYNKYQICKERNCFSGDCWICQNNAIMVRPPQSWCYVEEEK